jgi:hypothetical protein
MHIMLTVFCDAFNLKKKKRKKFKMKEREIDGSVLCWTQIRAQSAHLLILFFPSSFFLPFSRVLESGSYVAHPQKQPNIGQHK